MRDRGDKTPIDLSRWHGLVDGGTAAAPARGSNLPAKSSAPSKSTAATAASSGCYPTVTGATLNLPREARRLCSMFPDLNSSEDDRGHVPVLATLMQVIAASLVRYPNRSFHRMFDDRIHHQMLHRECCIECCIEYCIECCIECRVKCSIEWSIKCCIKGRIACSIECGIECSIERCLECSIERCIECWIKRSIESLSHRCSLLTMLTTPSGFSQVHPHVVCIGMCIDTHVCIVLYPDISSL